MLRFSAVWLACLLFPYISLPHYHFVPFHTLFGVACRCNFLHFFYTKDIIEIFLHARGWCRMLEAPMHVGSFLVFPFKSLLCQVHPEILKALVHPSGKSSGIESTASNRQHGVSCWMRSSRRPSFVRYEWSQSGRPKISTKRQVQCSASQGFRQQGTKRQNHQCRR